MKTSDGRPCYLHNLNDLSAEMQEVIISNYHLNPNEVNLVYTEVLPNGDYKHKILANVSPQHIDTGDIKVDGQIEPPKRRLSKEFAGVAEEYITQHIVDSMKGDFIRFD
jgi:hypothetical protein